MRIYRKKCEELGVTPSKLFRNKVEEALEGDTPHVKKVTYISFSYYFGRKSAQSELRQYSILFVNKEAINISKS